MRKLLREVSKRWPIAWSPRRKAPLQGGSYMQ